MSGFSYHSAAVTGGSFASQADCYTRSSEQQAQVLGGKIDRVARTIVGLEGCWCGRIGSVLVAATRIIEQGRNDRQQHNHDDADDGDTRDQELYNVHVAIMARRTVKNIYLRSAVA